MFRANQNSTDNGVRPFSRRTFLTSAAAASAAALVVPRHVLGGKGVVSPSDKLNIAGIGVAGMGGGNVGKLGETENIVALCDVDAERAAGTFAKFPKAKQYQDFRVMLDELGDQIDAVVISTPDHVHAAATMAAIKRGKHVYCEKPLTHTIHEARQVAAAAREAGVATQMGNSGHASEGARLTNEWIQAGVIGEVREVHVWSDRAGNMWAQGIPRPAQAAPVPPTLAWELWLGPAPARPYNPGYAPVAWRGWWDFGTGALGDMGCHIIDHPFWALELGQPASVQAAATTVGSVFPDGARNMETYPLAAMIHYEFPARGDKPPVGMTWYDGGLMPPTPVEMAPGEQLGGNGALFVGSEGKLYCDSHGGMPRLIPAAKMQGFTPPPQTMERSIGHHAEWIAACKGGKPAVSNFDYAGPLSEVVLLGNLALRAPGQRLVWNSESMQVENLPELNQYVTSAYRDGWTL
ncbi:MAG: Gfo/Idh/MocA family oxidoreductase [Pirellulales bacterium]